jgi:tRNA nucleotidyltransferase (CCA-adding enzyme)
MGKTTNQPSIIVVRSSSTPSVATDPGGQLDSWRREIGALGLPCYQVGGVVRDTLLGQGSKDLDICVVGMNAEQLGQSLSAAGRVEPLIVAEQIIGYRCYPTWGPEEGLEFALARHESSTGPGHTDFAINTSPDTTIIDDLRRRDFTANALAQEISSDGSLGPIIDPFGGQADIEQKILRMTSPEMIAEDPLRILRGLRRVAIDQFSVDPQTAEQFAAHATAISQLSVERVFQELNGIIAADNPAEALRLARDLGVYQQVFPELQPTIGFDQQSRYHDLTVDEHCLRALQHASELQAPLAVRWAALLHDSGKPASAWLGTDGRLHYYRNPDDPESRSHEDHGVEIAGQALTRLRAPKELQEKVQLLITEHMFTEDRSFAQRSAAKNARAARRMIARVGADHIDDLLLLRHCDLLAKGDNRDLGQLPELQELIAEQRQQPLTRAQLAINGHDLQSLGLRGPEIGAVLDQLLARVIAEPEHNNRQQLLRWGQKLGRGK